MSAVLLYSAACSLTTVRWAPIVAQPRAPRAAVRASEEELDRFFFDRAEVFVRSGPGGSGAVATQGTGKLPAGGTGGDGGSVYIECSAHTNTLGHLQGRAHVRADRGSDASGRADGTRGVDATVLVPPHTLILDRETNATLGQLTDPGERLLIVEGGMGGEGNGARYKRSRQDNKKVGRAVATGMGPTVRGPADDDCHHCRQPSGGPSGRGAEAGARALDDAGGRRGPDRLSQRGKEHATHRRDSRNTKGVRAQSHRRQRQHVRGGPRRRVCVVACSRCRARRELRLPPRCAAPTAPS